MQTYDKLLKTIYGPKKGTPELGGVLGDCFNRRCRCCCKGRRYYRHDRKS